VRRGPDLTRALEAAGVVVDSDLDHQFAEHGAQLDEDIPARVDLPVTDDIVVRFYLHRHGTQVIVGTRADWEGERQGHLCDVCDEAADEEDEE
jgi:hypothetical protein